MKGLDDKHSVPKKQWNAITPAEDFIEVVNDACRISGVDKMRMPNLVSDHRGPALISDGLAYYLEEKNIHHILASPYPPQTNRKIERYHSRE